MDEDRAAEIGFGRAVIMAHDQNNVISPVLSPKPFMAGGIGQADKTVIGGIIWGVAPAIIFAQGAKGQIGAWMRQAVGAIETKTQVILPQRRLRIAFAALRQRDGSRFPNPAGQVYPIDR